MAVKKPKHETSPEVALIPMEPWDEPLGQKGRALYSPRGLQLTGSFSLDDGMSLLARWSGMNNISKIFVGDLLVALERRFGEKYAQAMAVSGLEYGTVANYISTCQRVPIEVRPEVMLSMRVLAAVSPLADIDGGRTAQREILARAGAESLSSDAVREIVWERRADQLVAPLREVGWPGVPGLLEDARGGHWTIEALRDRVYQIRAELDNPTPPQGAKTGAVQPDEVIPPGEDPGGLRTALERLLEKWEADSERAELDDDWRIYEACSNDLRGVLEGWQP